MSTMSSLFLFPSLSQYNDIVLHALQQSCTISKVMHSDPDCDESTRRSQTATSFGSAARTLSSKEAISRPSTVLGMMILIQQVDSHNKKVIHLRRWYQGSTSQVIEGLYALQTLPSSLFLKKQNFCQLEKVLCLSFGNSNFKNSKWIINLGLCASIQAQDGRILMFGDGVMLCQKLHAMFSCNLTGVYV